MTHKEAKGGTTLDERIAAAVAGVANLCATVPHIFPEWQQLESAKDRLASAQDELRAAQAAWDRIATPSASSRAGGKE